MREATGSLLSIFVSYDARDRRWSEEIKRRVRRLVRERLAGGDVRFGDEVLPGREEGVARREGLEKAHVVLLLVSSDFLSNEQCMRDGELALGRWASGRGARVVPIVVGRVDWEHTPFAGLRALPPGDPPRPLRAWPDRDEGLLAVERGLRLLLEELLLEGGRASLTLEERKRLSDMCSDQRSWLERGGAGFVGRERELSEVRARLGELAVSGGYLVISAQAGQGKSSLIARLVLERGPERVAYHFIDVQPGPDYQVVLLRDVLARLVLVHGLEAGPLLMAGASRPALSSVCRRLLQGLGGRGEPVVIFLDGLDQLPLEGGGERDLGFLPARLPEGVVVVLGTRPDETLRQLRRLEPRQEYELPPLSVEDFARLLAVRGVGLDARRVERLYGCIGPNTLYLELAAQELGRGGGLDAEGLLERLADDPGAIFSVALDRLKRLSLWGPVIYPVLGLLLAAREPLAAVHLRQLLAVPDHQCREGLRHLGGFLRVDGQQRYGLYHSKFRHYLGQDEGDPGREYLFAVDELVRWHELLAGWCERGGEEIWQEAVADGLEGERRRYARWHLVEHLYGARAWGRLFALLDAGGYGLQKVRLLDASGRAYAVDLDMGRRAVVEAGRSFEEGLRQLPRLWAYTFLRCCLGSRADGYPALAFGVLVQLGRVREALGLAELLSDVAGRVEALVVMARSLQRAGEGEGMYWPLYWRASEEARRCGEPERLASFVGELAGELQGEGFGEPALLLWRTAVGLARAIEEPLLRVETLTQLARALCEAGYVGEAEEIIGALSPEERGEEVLLVLVGVYVRMGRWREAEAVVGGLPEGGWRARGLVLLAEWLAGGGEWERAWRFWGEAEEVLLLRVAERERSLLLAVLVGSLARVGAWREAGRVLALIPEEWQRVEARVMLVGSLARAGEWREAERVCGLIPEGVRRAEAQLLLLRELARAGCWGEAEGLVGGIALAGWRGRALMVLGEQLVRAGEGERGVRCWRRVEEELLVLGEKERCGLLVELAGVLAAGGLREWALECWRRAEVLMRGGPGEGERVMALVELGRALVGAGEWRAAREVVAAIGRERERAELLIELGRVQMERGEGEQAQRSWREAGDLLLRIGGERERAEVAEALAGALMRVGEWDEAERVVRVIAPAWGRGEQLARLARCLEGAGYGERAALLWGEAEGVVRGLRGGWEQADVLMVLVEERAKACIGLGDRGRWGAGWREVERLLGLLAGSWEQADVLVRLVGELARVGWWEEAEVVVRGIELSVQRAEALLLLGEGLMRAGEVERALLLLRECEEVIGGLEVVERRAELLAELGRVWAIGGRREEARRLWGESEGLIEALVGEGGRVKAWELLVRVLLRVGEWHGAERVIGRVPRELGRLDLLVDLVRALAEAGEGEEALRVARAVVGGEERVRVLLEVRRGWWRAGGTGREPVMLDELLREVEQLVDEGQREGVVLAVGRELAEEGAYEALLRLIQREWSRVSGGSRALRLFGLAGGLVRMHPELGKGLLEAFAWVDRFLGGAMNGGGP